MLGDILATCPKMASRRLLMLSITGRPRHCERDPVFKICVIVVPTLKFSLASIFLVAVSSLMHQRINSTALIVKYMLLNMSLIAAARCLLTYQYVISMKDGEDVVRRAVMMSGLPGGRPGRYNDPSRPSRTLLLGGRRDGRLCVYNWDTGTVDYVAEVMGLFSDIMPFGISVYTDMPNGIMSRNIMDPSCICLWHYVA